MNRNTVLEEILSKYGIENSPMNSGIGRGWALLFENCLRELQLIDFPCKISQIKEKFGELRIYFDVKMTPEASEIVDKACSLSRKTCIICGQPGKIDMLDGWYQCFCDSCFTTVKSLKKRKNSWDLIEDLYQNGK